MTAAPPPPAPPSSQVAAHSPETARAGMAALTAGGSAADAVAAMVLAACAVEPLVVSLWSGMHAIHVTPEGRVSAVDGFVDVPRTTDGGRRAEMVVVFDDEQVPYTIGGATFGTPGLVAGCAALVADHGRLPWAAAVEPAVAAARDGFAMSRQDEVLLGMLAPVMTLGDGARVFRRADGSLVGEGDRVVLPEVEDLLAELAADGPASTATGPLARGLAAFAAEVGALVDADDLAATSAVRHTPPAVRLGRCTVRSRRGLSPLLDRVAGLARQDPSLPAVVRLAASQRTDVVQRLGTTSVAATDRWGGACAATASLGLGTGDWYRGQQLNSMLGETDLLLGPLRPRTRMGSMMAPTAVLDERGCAAVLGAAGGSRIPSAVLRVVEGMCGQGLDPVAAVELPRLHRIAGVVHVEPHMPDEDAAALEAAGWQVTRWASRHHFFGGVSVAGRDGAQGDPRRGGLALVAGDSG